MTASTTSTAQGLPAAGSPVRAALAPGARPPRPGALSASLTFGWRALLKIWHTPEQLVDVISIPVLLTLVFTYLFGGALAGSTGEYLHFMLPGALVMTVALMTTFTGVGFNTDITKGTFDRFRSLPVWRPAPLVGALLGDTGRYALVSAIVVVLGLVMGFRPDAGAAGVLAALALLLAFSFSLAWIWITLALTLRTPTSVSTNSTLVLFPLTFASNTYVDPATMPGWLQAFVDVNPVSHVVTATRGLMHGTAAAGQVGAVLVFCAALVAVFAPLAMRLYRRR